MVRVEIRPSGRHEYAVVVEDYQDKLGNWKKRVVRSYGNAADAKNVRKANQFAAAVNMGKSYLESDFEVNREDLKKALKILAGVAVATAALAWLFGEE